MKPFASLLLLLLLTACSTTVSPGGGMLHHARWLVMEQDSDADGRHCRATVLNPWQEGAVLHSYDVSPCSRAVSATSLHAFLALRLGALSRLAGVMDADYIVAPQLRAALTPTAGRPALLRAVGSSQSPNLELLRAVGCDAILASPFENAGYGALETLGVPIIECADYMETTPLGRAEWMRFYGRLFGVAERADSLFAAEERAYQTLCDSVAALPPARETAETPAAAPTLLLGLRQGQAWYVPGGQSYLAHLYADAGFSYVFADEAAAGSVPLDFETVLARAGEADVWLITYAEPPAADGTFAPLTYEALAAQDERYRLFRPFRERRIWACNTLAQPYYDALPFAPAALLREAIFIAHPALLPGFRPRYFQPLQ